MSEIIFPGVICLIIESSDVCASFSFPDPYRLKDFKEFAEAIHAVKDKGVAVAVVSPDDVDAAHKERGNFFRIKKAL